MISDAAATVAAGERRALGKVRVRLLPLLLLLYVVAFLDRINVGFAALTMNPELGISSEQFGLLVGIFFIGYALFEIPSNLILHRVGARKWLSRILIGWGLVAAGTGLIRTVPELFVARFLLGLAEAGYYPGVLLYLSYWFSRREQAQAIAVFMLGVPIASAIGAPVSGFILDHVHWLGLSSWRWLLILEGLPAVLLGVLTYLLLPDRPADAKFLSAGERAGIAARLQHEAQRPAAGRDMLAVEALRNRRVWHSAAAALITGAAGYAVFFWAPQLLKALAGGSSNTTIGLLLAIPNGVALLAMVLLARDSDRRIERRWHVAIPALAAACACLAFGTAGSVLTAVLLMSVAVGGVLGYQAPFWALIGEGLTGAGAACGIALVTTFLNLGGFIGPYAFGLIRQNTGSMVRAVEVAGAALLVFAALVLLIPRARAAHQPAAAPSLR